MPAQDTTTPPAKEDRLGEFYARAVVGLGSGSDVGLNQWAHDEIVHLRLQLKVAALSTRYSSRFTREAFEWDMLRNEIAKLRHEVDSLRDKS